MSTGFLVDLTRCIGCRSCQVACKQWHDLPAEETEFFAGQGGYQNPPQLSADTFCVVGFNEIEDDKGDISWHFAKRQCMHCEDPSCASACLVGALEKTPEGPVVYDDSKCIGCRYCMMACPFGVPTFEWSKTIPYIRKCTQCYERITSDETCSELNGKPVAGDAKVRIDTGSHMPACAKACPTDAIQFGNRDELAAEAKRRIAASPGKYVDHIYGEKEAGGTDYMYLSSVSFDKLGFPTNIGTKSYPSYTKLAKDAVPVVLLGVGGVLAGLHWFADRKNKLATESASGKGE